ncbi:lytic murein transglycosylase [Vibrio sp. 10N.286.49.C2]|uniref:lytic transglycosylase domain-containing protein n=1 Tax=unclassified Vibrio TaxID=2614977 RepID=UPI000CB14BCD|nr:MULTISPECIES: lytic transglycosylase domain-containing protein [unclassified Vibrio]PMH37336.1 lytic murein transglycosylase [Vibrio sp. 10N.286.49.C2]PMH49424.1 lytic murein transglycosylase [Vibrio sp. 10N.286.49.B1]PMH83891.1 lytic murein transglycosylase [Vibrio sp. 10N.286.48.B7]
MKNKLCMVSMPVNSCPQDQSLGRHTIRVVTIAVLSLLFMFSSTSFAISSQPSTISQSAITPHLEILKPYQAAILNKLDTFSPLINDFFKQLTHHSLPESLILIPMLESSYNPKAVSAANAAGLWQLIPATATRFGLTVNDHKDDRFDIEASTSAALKYLDFLYRKFDGDINLTLAAYNAGEGRVQRAVSRAGTRQFDRLILPSETRQYVLRYHALLTLVDLDKLKQPGTTTQETFTPLFLFGQHSAKKQASLIDLTPLPALISL